MLHSNKWLKIYRLIACLLITGLYAAHSSGHFIIPTLSRMENIFYDMRLRATMPNTVDSRIVIVAVDEQSLAVEGRWPWSRNKIAYLMDMLFEYYNVKLVGFDMVFAEEDKSSGLDLVEKLADSELKDDTHFQAAVEKLKAKLSYDQVFANSLSNRKTVLGFFNSHIEEKYSEIGLLPRPLADATTMPFAQTLIEPKSYTGNLPLLQQAAYAGGFFNNPKVDIDGVYRRLPLIVQYHNKIYESLSFAMFRALFDLPKPEFFTNQYGKSDNRLEGIRVEGFTIPVDAEGAMLVPFRGTINSLPYVSAADVLNGTAELDLLKDKIVLFGVTAPGLFDSRATPVGSLYNGVEVHANILSGLLDERIKAKPNNAVSSEILTALILGLLAILVFPRVAILTSAMVFVLILAILVFMNGYYWHEKNSDLALAAPLSEFSLLYGVHLFFGFFLENRRKKQLGNIFGQYIPPELVAQMSQSDEEFSIQGESREMTVFFSDVRGFTTISETLAPHDLCELINAIFTPVTKIIHESQGTIDKYIGDAIMAFWGAPLHNNNHAALAVEASLNIIKLLSHINKNFPQKWPLIDMGIGLNTGTMSVGNMGSEFRMAYTVMGDAVNLGSRLEGLTKQYSVKIIVSEATKNAAPGFIYRELDRVRVKGKKKPITIYEPIAAVNETNEDQRQTVNEVAEALAFYRSQQWGKACDIFEELQSRYPDDDFYALYLERIDEYRISPPDENWDGVYTHTSK